MTTYNLWKEYKSTPTPELKRKLLLTYTNLVHYVIHQSKFYNQGILNSKDYFQFGIEGLSEAVERYDPDYGTKFETYAITRIRGKIIDEIRKLKLYHKVDDPNNSKSYYSNVSLDSPAGMNEDCLLYEMLPNDDSTPDEEAEKKEAKQILINEIKKLKERDRLILTLYYYEELNYKEIAEVLSITVSRVSQVHSRIIKKLKMRLELINE
jgi:RNA polymerase sigma factor for flagellar operon FliA